MKRDLDLIREICLKIEESNNEGVTAQQFPEHDKWHVNYQMELLYEEGYVKGTPFASDGEPCEFVIYQLTASGHKYLDTIRQRKTKSKTPLETIESNTGRRYAIIIGVSEYDPREGISSLPYTINDATRLRNILCDKCGFTKDRTKLHITSDGIDPPTRSNILASIQYISETAGPDDLILLFFAGHGSEILDNPYLLTADTRMNVVAKTALDVYEINSTLRNSEARCVIRIFDACRAPFSKGRGLDGRMTDALQESLFTTGTGWANISSCSSGQYSYETGEFEQGVFSYYLCEGLSGKAADDQGLVTLENLVSYIKTNLSNWSDKNSQQQTPHFQVDLAGVTELSRLTAPTSHFPDIEDNPFNVTNKCTTCEDEILEMMDTCSQTIEWEFNVQEMNLLIAAAESPAGEIHVTPAQYGINVLIGNCDFANPKTARVANQYEVILENFVNSGALKYTKETPELTIYSVTRMGFESAEFFSSSFEKDKRQ